MADPSELHALRAENVRLRQELDAALNPWYVVELRQIGEHRVLVERRSMTRAESVKVDVPPEGITAHFAGCMISVYVHREGDALVMSSIGNRTGRGKVLGITFERAPIARAMVVTPLDRDPIPFPTFHNGEVSCD